MQNRTMSWIVGIIVVIAVVLLVMWKTGNIGTSSKADFQAVFLSNGQVYFGKISGENNDIVVLTNIYYLQVQKQIQPAEGDIEEQKPKVQLIKLGRELHGPKDEMRITRSQILFVEDLKDDGTVVTKIKEFEAKGGASATPTPSAS